MPKPLRLPTLFFALALSAALSACDNGSGLSTGGATAMMHRVPLLALAPGQQRAVPLAVAIRRMSDDGDGRTVSILVLVSPTHAALVAGQKMALAAITDDRFGVTWTVSPSAGAVAPSRSFNNAAVSFTAPQTPGTYTVTATSSTNPRQSSSATIAVTDLGNLSL